MGQAAKIVVNAFFLGTVILAALLFLPRAAGMRVYAVLSSSMEPVLPVGSMIYVMPCKLPEEILERDIIAYEAGDGLVVHRVIHADGKNGQYETKGDFNKTVDETPVSFENIIGKVEFHIPFTGFLLMYVQKGPVRYLLLVSGSILVALALPLKKKEENEFGNKMESKR